MLVLGSSKTALVTSTAGILALAVATLAAAGCGSVVSGDDPPTLAVHEASTAARDACASSGAAICTRARECSPFWFGQLYTSLETCSAVFTAKCLDRYIGEGAAPSIADCSEKIGSLTCQELLDPVVVTTLDPSVLIDACPVTPGAFALGASCLRDGDCSTGHCATSKADACGTCDEPPAPRALRKIGEECTDSYGCASLTCAAGQCVENAKLGEPCSEARSCDLLAGLTCGSDSRCRPFGVAPVGHPCSEGYCETGSACDLTTNANDWTCKPRPTAGVGEPCTAGCASELTCTDGTCAAPKPNRPARCTLPAMPAASATPRSSATTTPR